MHELSRDSSSIGSHSVAIEVLTTQTGEVGIPMCLGAVFGTARHRAPPENLLRNA